MGLFVIAQLLLTRQVDGGRHSGWARSPAQRAHRVRARMARRSTRGPCAAVSRGRQARRGVDRKSTPFRQHMDVLSKSPAPAHGLAAQGWAASAKWGCRFLWVTSLLDKQKRSDSGRVAARKLLLREQLVRTCLRSAKSIAHRVRSYKESMRRQRDQNHFHHPTDTAPPSNPAPAPVCAKSRRKFENGEPG
jgi:hypothetical protein